MSIHICRLCKLTTTFPPKEWGATRQRVLHGIHVAARERRLYGYTLQYKYYITLTECVSVTPSRNMMYQYKENQLSFITWKNMKTRNIHTNHTTKKEAVTEEILSHTKNSVEYLTTLTPPSDDSVISRSSADFHSWITHQSRLTAPRTRMLRLQRNLTETMTESLIRNRVLYRKRTTAA